MKEEEEGSTEGLGQWTKLCAELPRPTWVGGLCRVGEELYTFG